jgi:hypothetical protein
MKCIYCGYDLEGIAYTEISAHKRKCSQTRRQYIPMPEPLKAEFVSKAESKISGFIISTHTATMTGDREYGYITPVEIDPIDKLLALTDSIIEQIDVLEKTLKVR